MFLQRTRMPQFRSRFALLLATILTTSSVSLAKTKWYYAQTDGFDVYSSASANETKKAIGNLRDARAILGLLMPSLTRHPAKTRTD